MIWCGLCGRRIGDEELTAVGYIVEFRRGKTYRTPTDVGECCGAAGILAEREEEEMQEAA